MIKIDNLIFPNGERPAFRTVFNNWRHEQNITFDEIFKKTGIKPKKLAEIAEKGAPVANIDELNKLIHLILGR